MRKRKRPFKFYLYIFLFSTVIIVGYTIYMNSVQQRPMSELYPLWLMPILFTGVYWGSDSLMDRIMNKKQKSVNADNREDEFLQLVSTEMRNSKNFLVEEFRKLQNNEIFQKDLKKAYYIYENGETEVYSLSRLEKKYRKNTVEHKAMLFVIGYIQEKLSKTE